MKVGGEQKCFFVDWQRVDSVLISSGLEARPKVAVKTKWQKVKPIVSLREMKIAAN